MREISIKNEN